MHHGSSVLLCFALLLLPISAKEHGKSYIMHRYAVGSKPKDGVMALEKAYRRRNWTPPERLSATIASKRDVVAAHPARSTIKEDVAVQGGGKETGIVTAKAYGSNTEYLCPVQIGEHTYNMDLGKKPEDIHIQICC